MQWIAANSRDPFADETRTKLALLRTYHVADTTKAWLLLQRRPSLLPLSLISKNVITGHLNETIPVTEDSTGLQLWQISGHYGVGGYLSRLLFQPPRLRLELTYRTGGQTYFRTALPLLKDGLLLSGHPRNMEELNYYWQSIGKLPVSARVRSIRVLTDTQLPTSFAPSITVTRNYYRLENSTDNKKAP